MTTGELATFFEVSPCWFLYNESELYKDKWVDKSEIELTLQQKYKIRSLDKRFFEVSEDGT